MTTDDHPQKITFGEMRASGVRDVLVFAAECAARPIDDAAWQQELEPRAD